MTTVVVLDRVEPDMAMPAYCVHGRVTCIACPEWCWLGDQTYQVVMAREADPICKQCAARLIPDGRNDPRFFGEIGDHRRSDGPIVGTR